MNNQPNSSLGRTVLTYRKLDFIGKWEYAGAEYAFRPASESDQDNLLVVTEGMKGVFETHRFVVPRRDDFHDCVIAPKEHNIVYVPARCRKKEEGDSTSCTSSRK